MCNFFPQAFCDLFPQPIRDIHFHMNRRTFHELIQSPTGHSESYIKECETRKRKFNLFVVSTFARITIAAIAVFAFVATQSYIPLAIAAVCSLPATAIAAGSLLVYYGAAMAIATVAAPALSTAAWSFFLLAAGWYILDNYLEIKRLGLLEACFLTQRPTRFLAERHRGVNYNPN